MVSSKMPNTIIDSIVNVKKQMFVKNIQLHGLNLVNEIYEFVTHMYFKQKCCFSGVVL